MTASSLAGNATALPDAAPNPTPMARPAGLTSAGGLAVNAPSIGVPLRFMLAGLFGLATGCALLILRPDVLATYHYNQYVIATTHVFVLGFIATIVMGAMYQLVPVALETHLYSERLARWQFALHLIGLTGMVWMFWRWDMKQVGHFGSAFAAGVVLFVFNIARTLLRVPRWNVVASAVTSSLLWLGLTVVAGLAIAAGKCSYESAATLPAGHWLGETIRALQATAKYVARFDQIAAMHAHAHLGIVGVFILLMTGVSYKLMPMFTLSEVQSRFRAGTSVLLLNLGLLGCFFSILVRSPWKPVFALLLIAGLAVYGLEMRAILRARKRRTLDYGLRYFVTALWMLAPLSVLGLVLSWPGLPLNLWTGQLENLYGFLAIAGVLTLGILGMLYKILPFLAWFGSYSPHIGRCKVPSLGDLYSTRLQGAGYWTYLAALVVTGTGIVLSQAWVVRTGACILAASVLIFISNAALILRHLVRPQLQPLSVNPKIAS